MPHRERRYSRNRRSSRRTHYLGAESPAHAVAHSLLHAFRSSTPKMLWKDDARLSIATHSVVHNLHVATCSNSAVGHERWRIIFCRRVSAHGFGVAARGS